MLKVYLFDCPFEQDKGILHNCWQQVAIKLKGGKILNMILLIPIHHQEGIPVVVECQ